MQPCRLAVRGGELTTKLHHCHSTQDVCLLPRAHQNLEVKGKVLHPPCSASAAYVPRPLPVPHCPCPDPARLLLQGGVLQPLPPLPSPPSALSQGVVSVRQAPLLVPGRASGPWQPGIGKEPAPGMGDHEQGWEGRGFKLVSASTVLQLLHCSKLIRVDCHTLANEGWACHTNRRKHGAAACDPLTCMRCCHSCSSSATGIRSLASQLSHANGPSLLPSQLLLLLVLVVFADAAWRSMCRCSAARSASSCCQVLVGCQLLLAPARTA
jgi:hypothetical protein